MSYDHFDEIIDRLYTSVKNRKQSLKLPSSVQVYDFKDSSTLDFWMQDYSIQNGSTFYEFESDESKVDYLSLRLEQNRQFAYQS